MKSFKAGDPVSWKWLGRQIKGEVISAHLKSISKVIKGKTIKRNGSHENPAYVVESDAGNKALKLHSELTTIPNKNKLKTPKMFQN